MAVNPPPSSHKKPRTSELKKPPGRAKNDADYEDAPAATATTTDSPVSTCCICQTDSDPSEKAQVDGCDHSFCFDCIAEWSNRENTCPLCKSRFNKITRCLPLPRAKRGEKARPNTKTVKARDQHSDMFAGSALEGLLASISAHGHIAGIRALSAPSGGGFIFARMGGVGGMGSMAPGSRFAFAIGGDGPAGMFGMDSDDEESDDDFVGMGSSSLGMMFAQLGGVGGSYSPPAARPRRAAAARAAAASSPAARARATAGRASGPYSLRSIGGGPSFVSMPPGSGTSTSPLEIDDSDDEVEVVHVS
jgi:hypothetical protein